jgi:DNA-directed RNA polymerase subunit M/transcription elongation factor TFIIS
MITLTRVTYLHEADMLCMRLEAEGIKTFIPDQNTASIQPFYSDAMGGVRVQVDEEDLARAREVLKDVLPQADRGIFTCPKCGSDSVEYGQKAKRSVFLSLLLIGFPLPWFKRECTCNSCGHIWKENH